MTSGLKDEARIKCIKIKIPFLGEIEWEPSDCQRRAAWELYVELVTRIATQSLDLDEGLARETLASLHSLFASTRSILRAAGPDVGIHSNSVGGVAIAVLNKGLRPFLATWHPRLLAHESSRPTTKDPRAWEREWGLEPRLRGEIELLRQDLDDYAKALAQMAGVEQKERRERRRPDEPLAVGKR